MRKLTRAAYANQRMPLTGNFAKVEKQKRNTMIALRGAIHVACFHHSCFCKAFGDASSRHGDWKHATFFSFARHILPRRGEYRVERMKTREPEDERRDERFDFHLDPNRVRTDAEIRLFADLFSITVDEARRELAKAGRRCEV